MIAVSLDPGILHTGIGVGDLHDGTYDLLFLYSLITDSKQTRKERVADINECWTKAADVFGAEMVICEAFEVQTWKGMQRSSTSMSKLINDISLSAFNSGLLFVLSSPGNKRGYSLESLTPESIAWINSMPKTKREHVMDACIHMDFAAKHYV